MKTENVQNLFKASLQKKLCKHVNYSSKLSKELKESWIPMTGIRFKYRFSWVKIKKAFRQYAWGYKFRIQAVDIKVPLWA